MDPYSSPSHKWLDLIELGVFNECLPQRINAAFHYLHESNLHYFTLKDFTLKGRYVLEYIGLHLDYSSSNFAIMDVFRFYDLNLDGRVTLEEFVIVTIERLLKLSFDADVHESIAQEILNSDLTSYSLLLDALKDNNPVDLFSDYPTCKKVLVSVTYILRDILTRRVYNIDNIKDNTLSIPALKELIKSTYEAAIVEVQQHFHISTDTISHMLLQTTPEASKLIKRLNKLQASLENLSSSNIEFSVGATSPSWSQALAYDIPMTPVRYNSAAVSTPHSQLVDRLSTIDVTKLTAGQTDLLQRAYDSLNDFFRLLQNEPVSNRNDESNALDRTTIASPSGHMTPGSLANIPYNSHDGHGKIDAYLNSKLVEAQMKLANVTYKNQVLELSVNNNNDKISELLDSFELSTQGELGGGGTDLPTEQISFDDVLRELNDVKSLVSERGTKRHLIGKLLDNECYIIPNEVVFEDESVGTVSGWSQDMQQTLSHAKQVVEKVHDVSTINAELNERIVTLRDQNNQLQLSVEQIEQERVEYISAAIDLQCVKEDLARMQEEMADKASIKAINMELQLNIRDLELKLKDVLDRQKLDVQKEASGQESSGESGDSTIKSLRNELNEEKNENKKLEKEVLRLKNLLKSSEVRMKTYLQDMMNLNQQNHLAHDDLTTSKTFIAQLLQDIEFERKARTRAEESLRHAQEMKYELEKKGRKDAKAESVTEKNLRLELASAENAIVNLENKLSEVTLEAEKGNIAVEQLDNYREQVRLKIKENRELSLNIHSLESRLKDMDNQVSHHNDVLLALRDCKNKIDKIPGLLAEIARLRGSSRASVKSLNEQDQFLKQFKLKIKQLESEVVRVKADRRVLQDTESKLKEANGEIAKLMTMVADLQAKLANNQSGVDAVTNSVGGKKGARFQHVVSSLVNSIRKAKADEKDEKKTTAISIPVKATPVGATSPARGTSEEEEKKDPNVVKMPVMRRRSSLMQRSIDPHDLDVIRKLSVNRVSFANEPSTQQDQLSDVPSEANSSVEQNETLITPAASVTAETVPEIMQNPRALFKDLALQSVQMLRSKRDINNTQ